MATTMDMQAIGDGSRAAKQVIERRIAVLTGRTAKESEAAAEPMTVAAPVASENLLGPAGRAAMAARSPKAYLIAEGDSWFDYPRSDVLDALEDDHNFRVERVAHRGDTVEDMAFNPSQIGDLARRFERLLQDRKPVRAVLVSGGGNDIAGDEFGMLLEHALSGKAAVNQVIADQVVNGRIRDALLRLIGTVNATAEAYLGQRIPIVVHGYGYPVADGRGFLGGRWFLPGPWLSPGFDRKGITDMEDRKKVMRHLIDLFNGMLAGLASDPAVGIIYVDVRADLSDDLADYKVDWANELHPSQDGFRRVAARIAAAIP